MSKHHSLMFVLRPYQTDAVNAVISHFRKHPDPAVVVLPTGAGKRNIKPARLINSRLFQLGCRQAIHAPSTWLYALPLPDPNITR